MTFDRDAYRRERNRELERRVVVAEAELRRAYLLLGHALVVAAGRECDPSALLDALCACVGTDPARPHHVELDERQARLDARVSELLAADPELSGNAVEGALRAEGLGVRRQDVQAAVRRSKGAEGRSDVGSAVGGALRVVPEPGYHHRGEMRDTG